MKRILLTMIAAPLCIGACGNSPADYSEAAESTKPVAPSAATTAKETPVERMSLARRSDKIGVPVDVRYRFSSAALQDQPTQLELAFVPQAAGQNLRVEFVPSDSVTIESTNAPMTQQKADAATVYRRNLTVTKRKAGPSEMRVLVSMDVGAGRYFGVFTIPVDEAGSAR